MNLKLLSRLAAHVAAAAVLCAVTAAAAQVPPMQGYAGPATGPIPGHYIVAFKGNAPDHVAEAARIVQRANGRLRHTYSAGFKGFAAELPEASLNGLKNHPWVQSIQQDRTMALDSNYSWGLDRIDQPTLPLDGYDFQHSLNGTGVTAYIVDSGIRADHTEFTGRISPGADFVNDGLGTGDCNGHGTHVAGTVGGATLGVARRVTLVPVRAFGCDGTSALSTLLNGLEWVMSHKGSRVAVLNLSAGVEKKGDPNDLLGAMVRSLVKVGVTVVVSAGNSAGDACLFTPALVPEALTVGATDSTDARWFFSNMGSCLDLFAPGVGIKSASNASPDSFVTMTGTSMAAPHAAGVAALYLEVNPAAPPAAVRKVLVENGTHGLWNIGVTSPNVLLNSQKVEQTAVVKTVAVMSLADGKSVGYPSYWAANAIVTVRDINTGLVVPGATVTGRFSSGMLRSCVTLSTGACKLSDTVSPASQVTFLGIQSITGLSMRYDASQNSASMIALSRP